MHPRRSKRLAYSEKHRFHLPTKAVQSDSERSYSRHRPRGAGLPPAPRNTQPTDAMSDKQKKQSR